MSDQDNWKECGKLALSLIHPNGFNDSVAVALRLIGLIDFYAE